MLDRLERYGSEVFSDAELLRETVRLCAPSVNVDIVARQLLERFGVYSKVFAAPSHLLGEIDGMNVEAIARLKLVMCAAHRFAHDRLDGYEPILGSSSVLLEYCRTTMAFESVEQLRVLFLDKKNHLLADEVHGRGTVDQVPIPVREIVRRSIVLSASALILVHNHPSGDTSPSGPDVQLTNELITVCKPLRIVLHDHIIVGRQGYTSLREMNLI